MSPRVDPKTWKIGNANWPFSSRIVLEQTNCARRHKFERGRWKSKVRSIPSREKKDPRLLRLDTLTRGFNLAWFDFVLFPLFTQQTRPYHVTMSLSLHASSSTIESLDQAQPNLMPFHIDHDGEAPISTYFLVKASGHHPHSDAPPIDTTRRVYESAFRGRSLHGTEVKVPDGYVGLTLRVDGFVAPPATLSNTNLVTSVTSTFKRKRVTGVVNPTGAQHKFARSLTGRRAGLRRTRSQTLAEVEEEEQDEESQTTLVGDMGDDMYALMAEEIVEHEQVVESSLQIDAAENLPLERKVVPIGSFDSLIAWNPDVPIDVTQDEFIRAIDEWTRLANIVSPLLYQTSTITPALVVVIPSLTVCNNRISFLQIHSI